MNIPAFVDQDMPQPNVIWIFSDQHRAQAMGCAGDPNVFTPNMDRMCEEGLRFSCAVSGSPLCTPFRAAAITGQYPHKVAPDLFCRVDPQTPTIAHAFNEAGYHTAYFGKWHLDGNNEMTDGRSALVYIPPERRGGFQHWEAYENNNSQWDCYVHGGDKADGSDFMRRLEGYETDALTDRLIEYVKTRATGDRDRNDKPFFAVLAVQPPHNPYVAPDRFMGRYTPGRMQMRPNVPDIPSVRELAQRQIAGYYGQIENVDWNIGRLRDALAQLKLDTNTHLVYFSDHGDMHGSQGKFAKMLPYAESINIPFIVGGHVPRGQNKAGERDVPLNHVDIAPTTLGLCGIDKPKWMAGCDFSGHRVFGRELPASEPDSAYLQIGVEGVEPRVFDQPWRGLITRDGWKYVAIKGAPWLMFNLREDPYEQNNLAIDRKYRAERKKLNDRLGQWVSDLDDAFTLPTF